MIFNQRILTLPLLVILSACNSSSSSDPAERSTGTIVDSPIINIGYETDTLKGVTNELGEYEYIEGESVTFFIGDLVFPAVKAQGIVTPLDIAATSDVQDSLVVNMIRLLQTLDEDGDPDNGITITEDAKAVAMPVDLTLASGDFAQLASVLELIENAGLQTPLTELVDTDQAINHFEGQLIASAEPLLIRSIVGTWTLSDETKATHDVELMTFSFFKDGTYLHHEIETTITSKIEFDQQSGTALEWGNYEHDEVSGELTIGEALYDGNGALGLVDEEQASTEVIAEVEGDKLTLIITNLEDEDEVTETFIFDRLMPAGIVGTWHEPGWKSSELNLKGGYSYYTLSELQSVSFFSDGTYNFSTAYVKSDSSAQKYSPNVSVGKVEWGEYSYDEASGKITVITAQPDGLLIDFIDSDEYSLTASVVDDMLVIRFANSEDFYREGTFFNEYMTIPAPAFSVDYFSEHNFRLVNDQNQVYTIGFDKYDTANAIGTGTLIDYSRDSSEGYRITWTISDGRLLFTEKGSDEIFWDWTLTPTKIYDNDNYYYFKSSDSDATEVIFEVVNRSTNESESGMARLDESVD